MKYIVTIIALAASTFLHAQSNKEAEKLMADVRKKTESFKTQTIAFSNEIDAPTGKPDKPRSKRTSTGTAKIKGQKYRIELDGMIFLNDGKSAFIIYPDDEEINAFRSDDGSLKLTPSSILASYQKGYSYAMAGQETVKGKKIQYIRLKPKAAADVKEILIGLDVNTNQLYSFKQFAHDGVNTTFTVTSYAVDAALSDTLFSISAPEFKGFELIKE